MRYTLSSLLNKLYEIENKILELYRKSVNKIDDNRMREFIDKSIVDTEKRLGDIDWVKSFIIVEMTLEPIIGPDLHQFYESIQEKLENRINPESLKDLESIRIRMYEETIKMVETVSPELVDVLEGFIRRSRDLISTL